MWTTCAHWRVTSSPARVSRGQLIHIRPHLPGNTPVKSRCHDESQSAVTAFNTALCLPSSASSTLTDSFYSGSCSVYMRQNPRNLSRLFTAVNWIIFIQKHILISGEHSAEACTATRRSSGEPGQVQSRGHPGVMTFHVTDGDQHVLANQFSGNSVTTSWKVPAPQCTVKGSGFSGVP